MSEFNKNLWAPWRTEYIETLDTKASDNACFLCDYGSAPDQDAANFVLRRTPQTLVVMNRYPYTNGHMLIAPLRHVAGLDDLDDGELLELNQLTRDGINMLERAVQCQGCNVGMNFGRCAGAGLPGHLHAHIVPRWNGDTNFMFTVGDARVIPQSMEEVFTRLQEAAQALGLS